MSLRFAYSYGSVRNHNIHILHLFPVIPLCISVYCHTQTNFRISVSLTTFCVCCRNCLSMYRLVLMKKLKLLKEHSCVCVLLRQRNGAAGQRQFNTWLCSQAINHYSQFFSDTLHTKFAVMSSKQPTTSSSSNLKNVSFIIFISSPEFISLVFLYSRLYSITSLTRVASSQSVNKLYKNVCFSESTLSVFLHVSRTQ